MAGGDVKFCLMLVILSMAMVSGDEFDEKVVYSTAGPTSLSFQQRNGSRYLLYEVNPGEGFNLRRDVYLRVANLVKVLNDDPDNWWTLVLPPWSRLYHWQSVLIQNQIPWSTFFDLESMSHHVPVMEFVEFLNVSNRQIDEIYYLQNYKEGWKDGKWEEKMDERECIERNSFIQDLDGERLWRWAFWDYPDVTAKKFKCLSIQAQSTFMKPFLQYKTAAKSVFLVRAEQLIHGSFSEWSPEFWTARRSMRFAKHLRAVGDEFRRTHLNSNDVDDKTVLKEDWRKMKRKHGSAAGGPYLAVHLRRRDFLYSHKKDVPSVEGAARQIESALNRHNLTTVFVATDAPAKEFEQLRQHLSSFSVINYEPPDEVVAKYKDGGVAIIDQWICAHARHFIGTAVSTFSFRIHEEREILGFQPESTFNCFCADDKPICDQPSKWVAIYS